MLCSFIFLTQGETLFISLFLLMSVQILCSTKICYFSGGFTSLFYFMAVFSFDGTILPFYMHFYMCWGSNNSNTWPCATFVSVSHKLAGLFYLLFNTKSWGQWNCFLRSKYVANSFPLTKIKKSLFQLPSYILAFNFILSI